MPEQIRILFIDDDPINQALNEAILLFHQQELCENFSLDEIEGIYTSNIKNTVDKLNECIEENYFPCIILSDIQLIDNTGFDFLERYKDHFLEDYPNTVVALITANITSQDKEFFKKFEFAYSIFIRPINKEILTELLQKHINRNK